MSRGFSHFSQYMTAMQWVSRLVWMRKTKKNQILKLVLLALAADWIAGKVTVRETGHAPYQFLFGNGKIIPSDKPGSIKKQLKLISKLDYTGIWLNCSSNQIYSDMEGLSTRRAGAVKSPKDQYVVTITTGEQSEAGIDSTPTIVFYGENGRSKSLPLVSDQKITPGSVIDYPVRQETARLYRQLLLFFHLICRWNWKQSGCCTKWE